MNTLSKYVPVPQDSKIKNQFNNKNYCTSPLRHQHSSSKSPKLSTSSEILNKKLTVEKLTDNFSEKSSQDLENT